MLPVALSKNRLNPAYLRVAKGGEGWRIPSFWKENKKTGHNFKGFMHNPIHFLHGRYKNNV
jgi:hypothetical protein